MSNSVAPLEIKTSLRGSKPDLAVEKVVLKVILPRGQTTAVAVSKDASFMEILDRVCQKRNISINKHVLFINIPEQLSGDDADEDEEPQMESILVDLVQKLSDFTIKSVELCEDLHAEMIQIRPDNIKAEVVDLSKSLASPTKLIQERRQSRQQVSPTIIKPVQILKEDKGVIKSFFGKYSPTSTSTSPSSLSNKKKKVQNEKRSDSITEKHSEEKEGSSFSTLGRGGILGTLKRQPTLERRKNDTSISISSNPTGFDKLELQANQIENTDSTHNSIAPWDEPEKPQQNQMEDIAPFAFRPHTQSSSSQHDLSFSIKSKSEESSLMEKAHSFRTVESEKNDSESQINTPLDEKNSIHSIPLSEDTALSPDSKASIRKKASMSSMTLRKQTLTKKSRSAIQQSTDVFIFEVSDNQGVPPELQIPANMKMVRICISLYDKDTQIVLKCSQETIVDDILKHLCEKRNYDYQIHSLEPEINDNPLELDRPISYYTEKFQIYDYALIKGDKEYTIRSYMDGDKEVALYQKYNNENSILMAAALDRMIEILTTSECDDDFLDTFLMCYRNFLKPIEFFDILLSRFDAQLPENATPEDIEYYRANIPVLQSQIMKIFDVWIVKYWFDFAVNSDLKNDLIDVLDSLSVDAVLGDQAISLIEAVASENEKFENLVNISKASNSKSKQIDSMLIQYSSDEVAEQLSLVNSQLYQSIHPIEFLNYIWRKKGEEEEYPTPMLDRFISRFDNESYWVATEICDTKDLKKRIQILTQIILVAKKCIDLNNFFSAFSLLGGLSMLPVERLKKTWKGLSVDTKKAFEDVQKFCDPSKNMKSYRDKLGIALPPIVPFLRNFHLFSHLSKRSNFS
eukprot:NODE_230_length_12188_cov_0.969890.p2 type:complete len:857 gc:universal NODE_230_length_12188_cov_0.969890:4046-6616(+)